MSAALTWSDELCLEMPAMDQTHREFVDLLANVSQADDAELLDRWRALVEHTEAHFAQEDAWMQATHFSTSNCHTTQHHMVLQVLREAEQAVRDDGSGGKLAILRRLGHELAEWFPQHAQTMDAALAFHLKSVGFDPASGTLQHTHALPATPIHGCGSGSCGDAQPTATASPPSATETATV